MSILIRGAPVSENKCQTSTTDYNNDYAYELHGPCKIDVQAKQKIMHILCD